MLGVALAACGQPRQGKRDASLAARQAEVVERGRSVMPFDIERTMHHFQKQSSGGIQQVVSIDGDPHQVALIRQHMQAEAIRFERGDFSDPSAIHGRSMPGLGALAAGAGQLDIRYSQIPGGAQISYAASDPALVGAIHAWFDAQVKEHGHHAMPM
jgi:hypothetical protein